MTEVTASSDDEINLVDLALILAENIRLLIVAPILVGLCALGLSYLIAPTFTAATRILPPQQQQSSALLAASQFGALAGAAGAIAGIRNPADTYVAMIKSRTVGERLVDQFDLRELYKAKLNVDAQGKLAARTRAIAGKEGFIIIEVDDLDPVRAAAIANAYVEQLRELMQKLAITEAAQRRVFFENQLKQARDDLAKAEVTLRSSGVGEAAIKSSPQATIESVARLKAQMTAQEIRIASMRGAMTSSNPEIQQAERELGALRAQLFRAEQNENSKIAAGNGEGYIAKFREFKYREALFDLMARQYESARVDEARDGALIQVIDPAVPPERKSKPNNSLIAIISALVAGLIAVIYVFLRHAIRVAATDTRFSEKLALLSATLKRKLRQ